MNKDRLEDFGNGLCEKVNGVIQDVAGFSLVAQATAALVESYTRADTIVGTVINHHSGFAKGVKENLKQGMNPFDAVVATAQEIKGRTLTPMEQTAYVVNTAMGGIFELAGRALKKLPLPQHAKNTIQNTAVGMYLAADWPEQKGKKNTSSTPSITTFTQTGISGTYSNTRSTGSDGTVIVTETVDDGRGPRIHTQTIQH